jgi:hypothetical protein
MLDFARLCKTLKRYGAAGRLIAEAFAADPKLAEDPTKSNRYNAACYAALAGSGQGDDDPKPDSDARAGFHRQAFNWLQADLDSWSNRLGSDPKAGPEVNETLRHWREDRELTGVRDAEALDELPAEERVAWRNLWAEVDALQVKARAALP